MHYRATITQFCLLKEVYYIHKPCYFFLYSWGNRLLQSWRPSRLSWLRRRVSLLILGPRPLLALEIPHETDHKLKIHPSNSVRTELCARFLIRWIWFQERNWKWLKRWFYTFDFMQLYFLHDLMSFVFCAFAFSTIYYDVMSLFFGVTVCNVDNVDLSTQFSQVL